jgi:integrase
VVHVAVFTWTGWQLSRGLSGNLPMDWVAGIRGIRRSVRDVQQLAGHASLQTTQRYIEGDTDAKRKLVQLI